MLSTKETLSTGHLFVSVSCCLPHYVCYLIVRVLSLTASVCLFNSSVLFPQPNKRHSHTHKAKVTGSGLLGDCFGQTEAFSASQLPNARVYSRVGIPCAHYWTLLLTYLMDSQAWLTYEAVYQIPVRREKAFKTEIHIFDELKLAEPVGLSGSSAV